MNQWGFEGLKPASTGGVRRLCGKVSLLIAIGLASCTARPAMASRYLFIDLPLVVAVLNDGLLRSRVGFEW